MAHGEWLLSYGDYEILVYFGSGPGLTNRIASTIFPLVARAQSCFSKFSVPQGIKSCSSTFRSTPGQQELLQYFQVYPRAAKAVPALSGVPQDSKSCSSTFRYTPGQQKLLQYFQVYPRAAKAAPVLSGIPQGSKSCSSTFRCTPGQQKPLQYFQVYPRAAKAGQYFRVYPRAAKAGQYFRVYPRAAFWAHCSFIKYIKDSPPPPPKGFVSSKTLS